VRRQHQDLGQAQAAGVWVVVVAAGEERARREGRGRRAGQKAEVGKRRRHV